MKLVISFLTAFSLVFSTSFSGIDVESIAAMFHILDHDHSSTNIKHDVSDHGFEDHHHHEDSHNGESHDHTINLAPTLIALHTKAFSAHWLSVDRPKYSSPYIRNRRAGPEPEGLYRPPKC